MTGLLWSIATTTASTSSYPDGTTVFCQSSSQIRIVTFSPWHSPTFVYSAYIFPFFDSSGVKERRLLHPFTSAAGHHVEQHFEWLSPFLQNRLSQVLPSVLPKRIFVSLPISGVKSYRPSITESDDTTSPIPAFEREGRLVRLEARTSSRKQNPNNSRIPARNQKLFFALFILPSFQTGPRQETGRLLSRQFQWGPLLTDRADLFLARCAR